MTYCHCPRCERETLFQTGAFWACGVCGYAITQSALAIEQNRANNTRTPSFGSTQ